MVLIDDIGTMNDNKIYNRQTLNAFTFNNSSELEFITIKILV
jgi:hypothetical protein